MNLMIVKSFEPLCVNGAFARICNIVHDTTAPSSIVTLLIETIERILKQREFVDFFPRPFTHLHYAYDESDEECRNSDNEVVSCQYWPDTDDYTSPEEYWPDRESKCEFLNEIADLKEDYSRNLVPEKVEQSLFYRDSEEEAEKAAERSKKKKRVAAAIAKRRKTVSCERSAPMINKRRTTVSNAAAEAETVNHGEKMPTRTTRATAAVVAVAASATCNDDASNPVTEKSSSPSAAGLAAMNTRNKTSTVSVQQTSLKRRKTTTADGSIAAAPESEAPRPKRRKTTCLDDSEPSPAHQCPKPKKLMTRAPEAVDPSPSSLPINQRSPPSSKRSTKKASVEISSPPVPICIAPSVSSPPLISAIMKPDASRIMRRRKTVSFAPEVLEKPKLVVRKAVARPTSVTPKSSSGSSSSNDEEKEIRTTEGAIVHRRATLTSFSTANQVRVLVSDVMKERAKTVADAAPKDTAPASKRTLITGNTLTPVQAYLKSVRPKPPAKPRRNSRTKLVIPYGPCPDHLKKLASFVGPIQGRGFTAYHQSVVDACHYYKKDYVDIVRNNCTFCVQARTSIIVSIPTCKLLYYDDCVNVLTCFQCLLRLVVDYSLPLHEREFDHDEILRRIVNEYQRPVAFYGKRNKLGKTPGTYIASIDKVVYSKIAYLRQRSDSITTTYQQVYELTGLAGVEQAARRSRYIKKAVAATADRSEKKKKSKSTAKGKKSKKSLERIVL